MLGNVSGSILENMLPGERPSVLLTAKLNMAVDRSDPDSTEGSSIGDGGLADFQMPSFGKLFSNSSSDLDAPVDKQVRLISLFNAKRALLYTAALFNWWLCRGTNFYPKVHTRNCLP